MCQLKTLKLTCRAGVRRGLLWAMLALVACPPTAFAAEWKGTRGRTDSDTDLRTTTPPPPPPPSGSITHGYELNAQNVGLSGVGLSVDSLSTAAGGKASALANARDPETGWPMLHRLDINGYVNVDVNCVIDQCRIRKIGPTYAISSPTYLEYVVRDCNIIGIIDQTNGPPGTLVVKPWKMLRCVLQGGTNGVDVGGGGHGCLLEECYIYGQQHWGDSHDDAVQQASGAGDYDYITYRRCRLEGPWREQTSALIIKATFGNISGVTIDSCFLSGGTFTLYTLSTDTYSFSKLVARGNLWAQGSEKYGLWSREGVTPDVWEDNFYAPVTTSGESPVQVDLAKKAKIGS